MRCMGDTILSLVERNVRVGRKEDNIVQRQRGPEMKEKEVLKATCVADLSGD